MTVAIAKSHEMTLNAKLKLIKLLLSEMMMNRVSINRTEPFPYIDIYTYIHTYIHIYIHIYIWKNAANLLQATKWHGMQYRTSYSTWKMEREAYANLLKIVHLVLDLAKGSEGKKAKAWKEVLTSVLVSSLWQLDHVWLSSFWNKFHQGYSPCKY